MIYLDHHSGTNTCTSAVKRMTQFAEQYFASHVSPHKKGEEILYYLEHAYQLIYDFLGASYEDTFVFTSSVEQSIRQLFYGIYFDIIRKTGKSHIITFKTEDAAIFLTLKKLEELGCVIHIIDTKEDGSIDLRALKSAINPRTALVSLSWASGLTGILQPIDCIAEICEKHKVPLHVDASYILGKISLPLNDLFVSYLTFSGSFIHGPKGSGGIFMKKENELSFILDANNRADINVPSLMGLASACQQCILSMDQMTLEVAKLRKDFEQQIKEEIPSMQVLYEDQPRLPNVSCMAFEKVHSEALLYELNNKGVFANLGGGRSQHLSNVFQGSISHLAISFAMSRYTTRKQVDEAAEIVVDAVKKLRKISEDL